MPHNTKHKDAIKRQKQSRRRRERNRSFKSRMRNQIKRVRTAIDDGDHATAQDEFRKAMSITHRLVSKGIIHRNSAARRLSRLNAAVKALAQG